MTGELQLEQDELDGSGRQAGLADQLIDRHGRRAEQVPDRAAVRLAGFGGLLGDAVARRTRRAEMERADCLQHVLGALDQGRAFADACGKTCVDMLSACNHAISRVFPVCCSLGSGTE